MKPKGEVEKDAQEIMEEYYEAKDFSCCFEGERGVAQLETLVKDLGYTGDNFKYGDPISSFLSDNSGCIEAIIEWIKDNLRDEQMENLNDAAGGH
jgi:hypothetical protein